MIDDGGLIHSMSVVQLYAWVEYINREARERERVSRSSSNVTGQQPGQPRQPITEDTPFTTAEQSRNFLTNMAMMSSRNLSAR